MVKIIENLEKYLKFANDICNVLKGPKQDLMACMKKI